MPVTGTIQLAVSGSFEITRPSNIPLSTWTGSFGNNDSLQDEANSGYWDRVTPYFTYTKPSASVEVVANPFTQSVFDNWADVLAGESTNMSASLRAVDL
jgi:hypothetical protein|tara:strand:- start:42 stop:338 length:297 start_codon:yes stop_codon:yes gene_type:complete